MHPYRSSADYWRIRPFLRQVFALNQRHEASWCLPRFDYWFSLGVEVFERDWINLEEAIFLWETDDGRLAAVLNPESRGEVYLQVHPDYASHELEAEMLDTAETYLAAPQPDGRRHLQVWTLSGDTRRQAHLTGRGYTKAEGPEYMRRRSLETPIPDPVLPPGYSLRALRAEDLEARSLAGRQAFHAADQPIDAQLASGEWLKVNEHNPLYRRDLDLVALAPDGQIAAFCGVWFDDVTRSAYVEPVGTVPAYQRQGLGKALLLEGLQRSKTLGADLAMVHSYSERAGALYASVGFTEFDLLEPWAKTL